MGDSLYIAWLQDQVLWVRRFGLDFAPMAPALEVATGVDMHVWAEGVAFFVPEQSSNRMLHETVDLIADGDDLVACWTEVVYLIVQPRVCRRAQLDVFDWEGESFEVPSSLGVRTACGFEFAADPRFRFHPDLGPEIRGGGHRANASGAYRGTVVQELWESELQQVYSDSDGRLLLIDVERGNGEALEGPLLLRLACQQPPPAGDCERASELLLEAQRQCCEDTSDPLRCPIYTGEARTAPLVDDAPPSVFCGGNAQRCVEALESSDTRCLRLTLPSPTSWVTVPPATCMLAE